jgi:hypothetical protein
MRSNNEDVGEADARLEEAALLLEGMARELRLLKRRSGKSKTKVDADVPTSGGTAELQVGYRVRVVRKDKYRGRTGVVLGRHGRLFWDVRLDACAGHGECTIYKKDASFCVIPGR